MVLGSVADWLGRRSDQQSAADLAALSGARALRAGDLRLARRAALATARSNGARRVAVAFPDDATPAFVRVRVEIRDPLPVLGGLRLAGGATAEAELEPPDEAEGSSPGPGDYRGPLAYRQGRPMRPDVAIAFDRLERAARAHGIALVITSAFRTSAEQAELYARRPDSRWVAPPGHSLHRLATELDLGPPSAYAWLAAHAPRFRFVRRYAWEPWHFGFALNPGSAGVGLTYAAGALPPQLAAAVSRAAQRWSVSAALLSAQLRVESSSSWTGAGGAALRDGGTSLASSSSSSSSSSSADARAHRMRDLLRAFGAVPLALAAYHGGTGPVAACGCAAPSRRTRRYVASVMGLLREDGEIPDGSHPVVRLVR